MQQRQKQLQRKEELKKLIEEREKVFEIQKATKTFDEPFTTTTRQNLKDEMVEEIKAKIMVITNLAICYLGTLLK